VAGGPFNQVAGEFLERPEATAPSPTLARS
jgi:hypothetical protein